MEIMNRPDSNTIKIFRAFFDGTPVSVHTINTSRGEDDFRETLLIGTETGVKVVIKLSDNDFTDPERIGMWQKTIEEYLALGYYCPKIICDKNGGFPIVSYKGHNCTVYAEEYSLFSPIEDRSDNAGSYDRAVYDRCIPDIWRMTAKIASLHLDHTDIPSGYCLFDTFCPSDKTDEVLENALNWKQYAETLPCMFADQVQRIWKLWTENRSKLESVYHELPTSVFQADLNPTNLLIDKDGRFVGVYDFNLCGKDVFLNYLMRENLDTDFEKEIGMICEMLKVSREHYHFSEREKGSALMIYRCLKPLWYNKIIHLKELGSDQKAIRAFLDKTEHFLTRYIDFKTYM